MALQLRQSNSGPNVIYCFFGLNHSQIICVYHRYIWYIPVNFSPISTESTKAIYDIGTKILFLQYFDRLPPKYDTWCRHSIRKMISASRRIFWHSFQPSIKKHDFSASLFMFLWVAISKNSVFVNQNKLWNMPQAAFDNEK